MEAKAVAKYIRISPRKMKFVCDMVRGKQVDEALAILKFHPGKGSRILEKVVKSADVYKRQVLNLEVVKVDADKNVILLKGAVPGPKKGLIKIREAVRKSK